LSGAFTPHTAASKLAHWLDAAAHAGLKRFPVEVADLALQVGKELRWSDPIFEVKAASIKGFEGGLFHIDKRGWALLYNASIKSSGRIRFTQAHELGHYLLHRAAQQVFECSQADMIKWGDEKKLLESQADEFAANLLMPMNHFRVQVPDRVDLDALSDASVLFGVSLTSAALQWIKSTSESAVLLLSRDGFIDWSVSSDQARKNGAFFKTRNSVIELPEGSIAADDTITSSREGIEIPLAVWFPHAHPQASVREMKLQCDNYQYTLTLLHLSKAEKVWRPFEEE